MTAVHAARRRLHRPPGDGWREHLRREVCRRELYAEAHQAWGELVTHAVLHETHPLCIELVPCRRQGLTKAPAAADAVDGECWPQHQWLTGASDGSHLDCIADTLLLTSKSYTT